MQKLQSTDCHCSCGKTRFRAHGTPLFRMYCHCTICQQFNDAPFADVVVYRADAVERPADDRVEFATYRPPPNVQRGRCAACGRPAIEIFEAPLMPRLTMVPQRMFGDDAALPDAVGHLFYNRRRSDAADDLPKHSGYVRSQLAFGKQLLRGLARTKHA